MDISCLLVKSECPFRHQSPASADIHTNVPGKLTELLRAYGPQGSTRSQLHSYPRSQLALSSFTIYLITILTHFQWRLRLWRSHLQLVDTISTLYGNTGDGGEQKVSSIAKTCGRICAFSLPINLTLFVSPTSLSLRQLSRIYRAASPTGRGSRHLLSQVICRPADQDWRKHRLPTRSLTYQCHLVPWKVGENTFSSNCLPCGVSSLEGVNRLPGTEAHIRLAGCGHLPDRFA